MTEHARGALALVSVAALVPALVAGCASSGSSGVRATSGRSGPATPSSASPTGTGLVAPDSPEPTASVCGKASGPFAVVETNPAAPAPRCVAVQSGQRLRVVNTSDRDEASGRTVTVRFADWPPRQVRLHQATTFGRAFGAYLAPGVHDLRVSLYDGPGTEIWLKH